MGVFGSIEKRIRTFRDRSIIKPLLRSNFVQKHLRANGHLRSEDDAAILNFGDHCIAFDPNDVVANALRYERGWFRDETMRIFDALPRRGRVFVDVGANIGTQTVYAMKFGGFDRAICFEPDPHNAWYLRLNMIINGFADRVTIIEAAAGPSRGQASLSVADRISGISNGLINSLAVTHGEKSISVPVASVEEELLRLGVSKSDISLAWIDVEGYEGQVMQGWPSLSGTPLCLEYTPEVHKLPADTFAGWERWAEPRQQKIEWQPISRLDLSSYTHQLDLLFS
jgi:FkbM family methyltransferase